jgi:phosphatidylinositol alpha-mannosyltransferase
MLPTPRLRLAMFSYGLPVRGQKRGGIERAAHTLADGLARRGHGVVVFSHDAKPDGAAYDVLDLPWKSFVNTWVGRRVTMGYLGNALAMLPSYHEFDAVIAHGDSLLLPLAGKPVLRILHGSALGEARSATSLGRCVLQLGVYAQELLTAMIHRGVVAGSENARRDNPFVQQVLPYAVDDILFRPSERDRSAHPSVLFVGALDGRKRGRFLLEQFVDTIRPLHPTASLTFVGAIGPELPGVRYLVGVDDLELADLYRSAWVYASPSTYEGFGLPYLEAMACGTPVVATPNPGSLEVFAGGSCGLLSSDADFASNVSGLLADPVRRRSLTAAGLARARDYSIDRMLDAYEDFLFSELRGYSPRTV